MDDATRLDAEDMILVTKNKGAQFTLFEAKFAIEEVDNPGAFAPTRLSHCTVMYSY
jgi:hypothetical protein